MEIIDFYVCEESLKMQFKYGQNVCANTNHVKYLRVYKYAHTHG